MSDISDTASARRILAKEVAARELETFEHCRTWAAARRRDQRTTMGDHGKIYEVETAYVPGDDPEHEVAVVVTVAVQGDSTNVAEVIRKSSNERGHAI